MAITLRHYQQHEIIDPLMDYLMEHEGNPIIASPTGTGKSLAINAFIKQCLEADPTLRFLVAVDVKEIIGQNMQSMLDYWCLAPVGCFSAGLKRYDTKAQIIYAGIQSIYNKGEQFSHIDIIICDEAHTISGKETSMWGQLFRTLRKINPNVRITGWTATPYRLGTGLLTDGELFTETVADLTSTDKINWFVEQGYLAPLVSKKPCMEIDITQVAMKGGEFDEKELAIATDKDDLNRAVVSECIKFGADRKHWLVYATGVTHGEHLVERFRSVGITADIIHGGLSSEQRTYLIGDKTQKIEGAFQKGKFRVLVNVGVLTKGFDFPALDMIVLARATQSTGLYIQILGRGTRPYPGKKNTLVLDFGGNIVRLGPFNAPVIPKPRRKGDAPAGEAPVKACPECGTYVHTRVMDCPDCGYKFPPSSAVEKTASTAEVMVGASQTPEYDKMSVISLFYAAQDTKATERIGRALRVSYSGLTSQITKFWFVESPMKWMRNEFQKWWTACGGQMPYPENADEAADRARRELKVPKAVTYQKNSKYKDYVSSEF